MKQIIIALLALILLGGGYFIYKTSNTSYEATPDTNTDTGSAPVTDETPLPVEPDGGIGDGAAPLPERSPMEVIGRSADKRDITAYYFGTGEQELLLIGNLHGGDAPNTAALTNELVTYFTENPTAVPDGLTVTIIPTLNPDGLATNSRFNKNNVDLNRNFDCDWSATSMWRSQEVSGGTAAFSEPEADTIRGYIENHDIAAAIVWFAAEGKVYPSACDTTPSSASTALANTFAAAAGYPTDATFDAYQINGDMVNWLAKMQIPAISVLLSDRTSTEWNKNLKGVEAVLKQYAE